jgi:hypothetical protein
LRLSGARKGVRCSRGLGALAKAGVREPRITASVNAGQNDSGVSEQPVPDDVRKTPQDCPSASSVPLEKSMGILTDAPKEFIDRFPKLGS